mgnify:CR=1 FL=1
MISSGENLPLFKYKDRAAGDFVTINLQQEMKGKKVVIFGLPGAYTPTCSSQQLPGYDSLYPKFGFHDERSEPREIRLKI